MKCTKTPPYLLVITTESFTGSCGVVLLCVRLFCLINVRNGNHVEIKEKGQGKLLERWCSPPVEEGSLEDVRITSTSIVLFSCCRLDPIRRKD